MTISRRVAVHAALGEPVRLAIVDALTAGDLSPGELTRRFAIAGNLLAHHLRVLEEAGVVRRRPSEGDRRRSYVQLRLDDPFVRGITEGNAKEAPVAAPTGARVVFVCTANSARSQLAAASWARLSDRPVASAGTQPARRVHPGAVAVGRRHGLRLGRSATTAVAGLLRPDDLVVAVCDNVHEELPAALTRLHWSVPDPVRADTDDSFETAYQDISRRVERLAIAIDRG